MLFNLTDEQANQVLLALSQLMDGETFDVVKRQYDEQTKIAGCPIECHICDHFENGGDCPSCPYQT